VIALDAELHVIVVLGSGGGPDELTKPISLNVCGCLCSVGDSTLDIMALAARLRISPAKIVVIPDHSILVIPVPYQVLKNWGTDPVTRPRQ